MGQYFLIWLAVSNTAAFILMGIDKRRSKKPGAWRIRERTLFLPAILGGSAGAMIGMRFFHHKTRHWYFVWGMPLILLVQAALAGLYWHYIH